MTGPILTSLLHDLWTHLSPRRHRQFAVVLLLMICVAGADIISIGSVLPFLSVLTVPERVFVHPFIQPINHLLGLTSASQLLLPLTIAFCLAALVSAGLRLVFLWVETRFSCAIGADLGVDIYRRTLYQPYAVHVARNSSDIISGITDKTETVIFGVITPALVLVSSSIILGSIIAILFWADPAVAFAVFGGFGAIYLLIILLTRRRLIINSQITADESTQVLKTLQEGLGGIRDVLLDGSQEAYCAIFKNADLRMHRAQGSTIIIGQSPRHGIELLGMLLIAGLAYSLSLQPDGIRGAIPVLGALALGAQRLLPLLQQAYNSWSRIQGSQVELQETLELLDQPMPDKHEQPHAAQSIQFIESIQLKKLGFRYNESSPWILKNIDLRITKGCRIGIIGMTASGKSTLIDIIMCLLAPTEGTLEIDGQVIDARNYRGWQAHIAHVPQSIYLADTSIAENIAFGVPVDRIDRRRVEAAACEAQIAEFVDTLPAKYDTYVGERGIRLSGGQRQRIGIARALYKQADVIIFDEATSALDTETENAVMQAIENLSADLTIIIIAHRVTTLKNCTQIVELSEGGISRIGTFTEIIK